MAGVVGKISCSKVRDLLRFPDFDDSNYLEKRKALVLHYNDHKRWWTNLEISHYTGINGQHWFSPQMRCSPSTAARGGTWRRLSLLSQELRWRGWLWRTKKQKAVSHQTQSAIRQEKAYAQRRSFINSRIRHRHHLLPDRPIQRETFTWIKPICSHVDRNVHHRFVLVWFRAGWWGFL